MGPASPFITSDALQKKMIGLSDSTRRRIERAA
ncbi:MAG: hypothetical protein RIR86_2535, partial [Acidobacteriota bacterium]